MSFLPFVEKEVQEGYFVDFSTISNIYGTGNRKLLDVFIGCSRKMITIERQYGKIDDKLAYVGGLFGIVMSFFAFFMMSYNEYRYELWISQGAFTIKDGVREKDFSFLTYIKYSLYDWINAFCCCKLQWADCKSIDSAREEAVEQIEVQHVLRKINHNETLLEGIVSTAEGMVMHLVEPKPI